MQRTELASLYTATPADGTKVTVCGWAKTVRDSKNIGFISLSDGSCYKPVQIVFQADKLANYAEIAKCGLYTSFEVTGTLVLTPNAKQPLEINADTITVLGPCGPEYPLQKKKMSMDYLRTMTHLRPRTNTFNAAFRVRGQAAFALHQFFHEHGFTYVHTPIFTGSDCEGAGEMFQVTTLDLNDIPRNEEGGVDYTRVTCPPEPTLSFRAPSVSAELYPRPERPVTAPARTEWTGAKPAYAVPQPVPEAPPAQEPRISEPERPPEPVQQRLPETEPLPEQEKEPIFSGREPVRVIGEALELYILVQQGDTLVVIDKHAAHERMIYNRLRLREAEVMSQTCLEPVPYTPDRAAAAALSEELPLINSLGFGLEPFGSGTFVLRSTPCGIEPAEALSALDELSEALLSNRRPDKNAARDELLKTVACKAAIKAGRSSEPEELQRLAEAVCSGEVRYCPHGRPVAWTLTRRELDTGWATFAHSS